MLVGVATTRTMRELFMQAHSQHGPTVRAWDLALYSGVSPQGSTNSLVRLCGAGLVDVFPSDPGCAPRFGLIEHPLLNPLGHLFAAERRACHELMRPRYERRVE
jgi:hypothetical protein